MMRPVYGAAQCATVTDARSRRSSAAVSAFRTEGGSLVGFFPGYDREEISPGAIKRVIDAIYAKCLVSEGALLLPSVDQMTPTVRRLYHAIFESEESHDCTR